MWIVVLNQNYSEEKECDSTLLGKKYHILSDA